MYVGRRQYCTCQFMNTKLKNGRVGVLFLVLAAKDITVATRILDCV